MVDKLDLRVPRHARFTPTFQRLYSELRALDRGPFHPSKHYEYAGDLREYGFSIRLNLYCRMDKANNHKLELIDVGTMSRTQIVREVQQVFEIDARTLSIMRIDFAVDVPQLPLQWFRETVRVQHKRFRSALTDQRFYGEIGKAEIETLYFGKRPNVIRIYDKMAEYRAQYRLLVRKLGKDVEPPPFRSVFPVQNGNTILTRVERQIGGRIPEPVGTLEHVMRSGFEFIPFSNLKIIDHSPVPDLDASLSFETRCTGLYLRTLAQGDGMQAVNAFISKHSRGNGAWVRKKYAQFLATESNPGALTEAELQRRFQESIARQMSA